MNRYINTTLFICLSLITQCVSAASIKQDRTVDQVRYEQDVQASDKNMLVNHSFYDQQSGAFLNISSSTDLTAKDTKGRNTVFQINTNRGTLIIHPEGISSMVDGHNEFVGHHEKSLQSMIVAPLVDQDLINSLESKLKELSFSLKSSSLCDAATTGAAYAAGQYATALFAGDFEGANFWYMVYQGHVYNMREFCEIK